MKVGKDAENVIMPWLKQNPSVVELADLTDLRAMQDADVDASIKLIDGTVILAEIKSDRWLRRSDKDRNVLFEVMRINHTAPHDKACTLGWTARSPAKWLFFWSPENKKVFQTQFSELRGAFQRYTRECRGQSQVMQIDWTETDRIKSTINVLIPWSYCQGIFQIHTLT